MNRRSIECDNLCAGKEEGRICPRYGGRAEQLPKGVMVSARQVHRGRRSRQARERRALDAALRREPVGVRQERTGRFYPNHDRQHFHDGERVPDVPPRDPYFMPAPGAIYVEVCDAGCARPGQNPDCRTCHGQYVVRREFIFEGRRST